MPCIDYYAEAEARAEAKEDHKAAAMLCSLFKLFGEETLLKVLTHQDAWALHGVGAPYVRQWWQTHKEQDAKRGCKP